MSKTGIATKAYDSADYLKTPEAIAAYLEDALEESEPALIAHALGVAARAHGMGDIAKKTKLSREALYRTLSAEGNPELETLIKVLSQLGLRLSVEPEKKVAVPHRGAVAASALGATKKTTSSIARDAMSGTFLTKSEKATAASVLTRKEKRK